MGPQPTFDAARPPRGTFALKVFEHGRLVEDVREPNLIVTGASTILANLLAGAGAGNAYAIMQIGYGIGTATPVPGNTTLSSPYLKNLDSAAVQAGGSIDFAFSLASGEDNGVSISEYGLLTGGGLLFSRKLRATPLAKTAAITLSGIWTIQF